MKKEVEMYLIAILLLGVVFLFAFYQPNFSGTGFAVFDQGGQDDFDLGTYNKTVFDANLSRVVLDENQTQGTYTSGVFDSGNENTMWDNVTYVGEGLTFEVQACDLESCDNASFSSEDLSDLNLSSRYFQYKAMFSQGGNETAYLSSVSIGYLIPSVEESNETNETQEEGNESGEASFVLIYEPSGEKDSLTEIPLNFFTNVENSTCWYNINLETNITVADCENTTLEVSEEGDYEVLLYVNHTDLISNSSEFSVVLPVEEEEEEEAAEEESESEETSETTTSTTSSPTTAAAIVAIKELTLSQISNQELNPGQETTLSVTASNSGNVPLSACRLSVSGENANWVSYPDESANLNQEDSKTFSMTLSVPEDAVESTNTFNVLVDCSETSKNTDFTLDVIPITFEFSLTDVRKIRDDEVSVNYRLRDLSMDNQSIGLRFVLFDNASVKVSEVEDNVTLDVNETRDFETIVPVNESVEGNLTIHVEINSQKYSSSVDQPVVLGGAPLLGFVAFGDVISGTSGAIVLIIAVLALIIVLFVVRRARKKMSKSGSTGGKNSGIFPKA